jgi:hypothetical protein
VQGSGAGETTGIRRGFQLLFSSREARCSSGDRAVMCVLVAPV